MLTATDSSVRPALQANLDKKKKIKILDLLRHAYLYL